MIKIIDWLIKIKTKNYASQFVSNGNAGSALGTRLYVSRLWLTNKGETQMNVAKPRAEAAGIQYLLFMQN